ncbi:MAG: hypothetical protein ACI959_002272 [Limisphaerales bacterium]|jgi:hypothetical protein
MKRTLLTFVIIISLAFFMGSCALFQGGECDCQKFGELTPSVDEENLYVEKSIIEDPSSTEAE